MKAEQSRMLGLGANRRYFIVAEIATQEVVAVLEAEHEEEARHFFSAVRNLLQAAPKVSFQAMDDDVPPSGIPVFHRQYLKAMQMNAQDDARVRGTVQH